MKSSTVKELYQAQEGIADANVIISGWVRTLRMSKKLGFIELNDGSCLKNIQIVLDETLKNFDELNKLVTGSAIIVSGQLVLTPQSKQPFELKADKIEVHGKSEPDYPLQKKNHSFEYLRTIAHLRPRTNTFSAVFRVRSVLTHAIHLFLHEMDFINVATPCITSTDCEGSGEIFKISTLDFANVPKNKNGTVDFTKDFFGKEGYVTGSGQLNVEPFCMAFRNVYTFGPCFRSENSNTTRHLAEFWQVEPEMAFTDLNELTHFIEAMTKFIIRYVLENAPDEMLFMDTHIEKGLVEKLEVVVNSPFARVEYTEAIEILKKAPQAFTKAVDWNEGISTDCEKYLAEHVFKKPVFVMNYPKEIKSFYMRLNDDNKTVAATDLLFPGIGEIVGASQREERYQVLLQRLNEHNLNKDDYWWYLELRKYGSCVHSGFGMGVERMMRFITGMENIRDVIPYPRAPKSAEF